jgi:hypothetical protein
MGDLCNRKGSFLVAHWSETPHPASVLFGTTQQFIQFFSKRSGNVGELLLKKSGIAEKLFKKTVDAGTGLFSKC